MISLISEGLIPRSLLRDVSCYSSMISVLQLVLVMSTYIHKSHNVSVLMYHLVFPAKYRVAVFCGEVDQELRDICLGIAQRYEIIFLEIGVDRDHAHFLVQSVPTYSPKKIVQIINSLTARYIFKRIPAVKSQLWGGEFWSDGYFVSTVGKHGDDDVISNYVKRQGQPDNVYRQLHYQPPQEFSDQLCLW